MGKPSARLFAALLVWVVVVLGNAQAQTSTSSISNRGSNKVVVCKKDSKCPSGQRCGFSGSKSKGKCVLPSHDGYASIPEVVADATVAPRMFSVRLAPERNIHRLPRVSLAVAQRLASRSQTAGKRV